MSKLLGPTGKLALSVFQGYNDLRPIQALNQQRFDCISRHNANMKVSCKAEMKNSAPLHLPVFALRSGKQTKHAALRKSGGTAQLVERGLVIERLPVQSSYRAFRRCVHG